MGEKITGPSVLFRNGLECAASWRAGAQAAFAPIGLGFVFVRQPQGATSAIGQNKNKMERAIANLKQNASALALRPVFNERSYFSPRN